MSPASRRRHPAPAASASESPTHVALSHDLLEALPDATLAVDASGIIVDTNSQTEELFGYKRKELIGQKVELLVPAKYRSGHQGHREHFTKAPKTRRMGAGLELYARRKDGSEFPVEISLSPMPAGDAPMILSAIRDISDRKRIEVELRRAHEELGRKTTKEIGEYRARLAAIIDSSEDAILSKDLDGIIKSWNKGAERIYGYSAEEVIGKPISMLVPKEHSDEVPAILKEIRQGRSVEHHESVRVTKDGRHLHVSVSVSPLHDPDGTVVGASTIARDMTAQKRAEEHLRQAQKLEAVGRLAGGVAHDFNNILGIITACTELLRGRSELSQTSSQFIGNIREAVERGVSLTRQLLAFSRRQTIQPRVLDLNDKIKDIVKLLRPLMGDDVEIVASSRSGAALIEADPGQLDQIVINLAVNARDAMPKGGKFIMETATVDCDDAFAELHQPMKAGRYVMLAVSDTGVGMDEATMARVFEPFFTTKEVGKGTGLGLATVYGIVQQSGGHVWVYSEPGHGTTFKIYLPSAEDKLAAGQQPAKEALVPRRQGTTVLLVEDDQIMRRLTRQLLEDHGYTVVEANDGLDAVKVAQSSAGRIDILLTDVVMRGLNGPELAAQLKKSLPGLRIVFMSGYTGELIAEHEMLQKAALLEKPFTRSALLAVLHKALE